jgi:hypothetical protein
MPVAQHGEKISNRCTSGLFTSVTLFVQAAGGIHFKYDGQCGESYGVPVG